MRQDTPSRRDDEAVGRAVEFLAARLIEAGMSRMSARVFAAVFTSPDGALTAAELGERLSVSPAAVSKAVQYLTQVRLLHREYVPGSRRDRYRVVPDVWLEVFGFRIHWLRSVAATVQDCIEAVGGERTAAGARLAELRDLSQFLVDELADTLDHWQAYRSRRPRPAREVGRR